MGGIAARRTGGGGYNALVIVSLGGNGLLSRKNLAANRAFFALGQSLLSTGRRDGGDGFMGMTRCRDGLLRGEDLIAHRAFSALGQSLLGAGGGYGGDNNLGVTRGGHLAVGVGMTADRAGMGGVAARGTGGGRHNRSIAVSRGGNAPLGGEDLTADRALHALGKAVLGTGGGNGGQGLLGVTLGGGLPVGVGMAADRAGMGGVAARRTGGGGHHGIIAVSRGGNRRLRGENRVTNGAVLALGQSRLGAGGSHGGVDHLGVTRSGYRLLCRKDFAADRAFFALGQARLGTSGQNGRDGHLGVTLGGCLSVAVGMVALGTGVGGVAIRGTGGGGHHGIIAVSRGGDGPELGLSALIAGTSSGSFFGAGCFPNGFPFSERMATFRLGHSRKVHGGVQERIIIQPDVDLIPLCLGAVIVHVGEVIGVEEGGLSDSRYAGGNRDLSHGRTVREGVLVNESQAVGKGDGCEETAIHEGIMADGGHALGDSDGHHAIAIVEGVFRNGGQALGQLDE